MRKTKVYRLFKDLPVGTKFSYGRLPYKKVTKEKAVQGKHNEFTFAPEVLVELSVITVEVSSPDELKDIMVKGKKYRITMEVIPC